jgi:proline iminopeptidase
LRCLATALGLDRFHLFGHSWGTILAFEYALAHPNSVASLVLTSPAINIPRWLSDLAVYRRDLPAPIRAALDRHEAAGTTDSPEYLAATSRFYQHHVCRMYPWPPALQRAVAGAGEHVYRTMWGENEFLMTGTLRAYDRTDALATLRVPVLYLCGRYDEATPGACAEYAEKTPLAEVVVFERSAHMAMLEEEAAFRRAVAGFLDEIERGGR